MAKPVTVRFGNFFIRLRSGTPAAYTAPCGFTSKSFTRTKTLGETNVPDCDNPDAPSWTERDVTSMSAAVSGEGVMAKSAVPIWEAALASSESIECEVELVYPDGGSDLYTGKFHLESFEINGTQGERVNVSVQMSSDGEIVYLREAA